MSDLITPSLVETVIRTIVKAAPGELTVEELSTYAGEVMATASRVVTRRLLDSGALKLDQHHHVIEADRD